MTDEQIRYLFSARNRIKSTLDQLTAYYLRLGDPQANKRSAAVMREISRLAASAATVLDPPAGMEAWCAFCGVSFPGDGPVLCPSCRAQEESEEAQA